MTTLVQPSLFLDRNTQFELLASEVRACRKCERMCDSIRVLNRGCGRIDAPIMVIGEAPGRLGADASAIPFHGDQAGHNFEELLAGVGLNRSELFVTNAALCNPKDARGNNSTPTDAELRSCSNFLREQIRIVEPLYIVTLGAAALKAIGLIEPHSYSVRDHVRTMQSWFGRTLFPLYHPGQRAMIHRSFANQLADYQFLAENVRRGGRHKVAASGTSRGAATELAGEVLTRFGGISYFAFHKLSYLAEVAHWKSTGVRLTDGYFIRQKDGPYCIDLHPKRLQRAGAQLSVWTEQGSLMVALGKPSKLDGNARASSRPEIAEAVDTVFRKYAHRSDEQLKTAAYMTRPMRTILKLEQSGINCFNAAIEFG